MLNYTLTLRTEGPVFVGNGQKIGKKEYVFLPDRKRVYIPDMVKLFRVLAEHGLTDAYEDYLLRDTRDFAVWLRENRLLTSGQTPDWVAYSIDSADAVFERRGKREILPFIKDPYGCPYVPGSSVKGMLRTILLSAMIIKSREKLENETRAVRNANLRGSRAGLLKQENNQLERRLLHTLRLPDTRNSDAVNSMMRGLSVSDSRPLSTEDLVLCQKVDVTTDGHYKDLPILRECIRPGTEISFDLTLRPDLFPYSVKGLLNAVKLCRDAYETCFLNAFPGVCHEGAVYLGGGCGYATKTFVYPLLGVSGVSTVSRIIDATLPFQVQKQHKHNLDKQKGASPHMLKCTRYHRKTYEMGACSIAFEEKKA